MSGTRWVIRFRQGALALLAAACLVTTAAAGAEGKPGSTGPGLDSPVIAPGLPSITKSEHALRSAPLSDEEAAAAPIREIAALIVGFESTYASDLSYSYFTDEMLPVVAFAGAAPKAASEALDETGVRYELIEYAGFTYTEYVEASNSVAEQLTAMDGAKRADLQGGFVVAPMPNERAGAIVVMGLANPSGLTFSSVKLKAPFSLVVSTQGHEFRDVGYGRHGGTWLLNGFGQGVCTSGFVAKLVYSQDLGVLTAAHCPRTLRYYNEVTGEHYPLQWRTTAPNSLGDAQFQRSPHMMDAWFVAAPGAGRPVLEVRDPMINEPGVCRYGKVSNNQQCGRVSVKNGTFTTSTGTYGSQAVINYVSALPGDSGGPVFGGNTAFGLVKAAGPSQLLVTQIGAAQVGTGALICRNPVCS